MTTLDPDDRDLARKRALEAAAADLEDIDEYIYEHPTLIDGFPVDHPLDLEEDDDQ